jgi:hypothetical protein
VLHTASNQSRWQCPTIFTAVLIGATVVIAVVSGGCEGTHVVLNNCPDAGAPDGGDAGDGGGGANDGYCD